MGLKTEEHVQVVVLHDVKVVLQRVRPGPLCAVVLRHRTGVGAVFHHIRIPGVLHGADIAVCVVDTEVRAEEHALDRCDIYICICKDTPFLQAVVLVVIELA